MGLLNFPNAPTNPGSLHGATREHRAILDSLQADAFRSASQNQSTGQAARAFSGSTVSNDNAQTASLSQVATATNTKTLTIDDVTATNSVFTTEDNLLQKYIAGANAADLLSRGAANVAQNQGGDQSGYAELNDFSGTDSTALNDLDQNAQVTQRFDVDLSATINNTTQGDGADEAFNLSRFRTIEGRLAGDAAQAIFTSGQRQGSADNPFNQVAVGNGGDVTNTLVQNATIVQTTNTVDLTADINLDRTESGSTLSHRATDLLAELVDQTSVNSSAASQEQAIMQSAAGGVDEDGNVTENGGGTVVSNSGNSNASNTESTTVNHSVSISI